MLKRSRKVQKNGNALQGHLTEHRREIGITEKCQEVEVELNNKNQIIISKKEKNMKFLMYDESNNTLFLANEYKEKIEKLPAKLDEALDTLYDKTKEAGDDCNAFQYESEEIIKGVNFLPLFEKETE